MVFGFRGFYAGYVGICLRKGLILGLVGFYFMWIT